MPFAVPLRPLALGLILFLALGGLASARNDRRTEAWVSGIVSKITMAEKSEAATAERGTVTIRLRVASDGAIDDAAVEESSGSTALDDRALRAIKTAAPFPPPPPKILTLEGFTELAFPLDVGRTSGR